MKAARPVREEAARKRKPQPGTPRRAAYFTPTLRNRLKDLPWNTVPGHSVVDTGHGRRIRRTVKAVEVPAWVHWPGAAQVLQIRRTRTVNGRKRIEVVYAICSVPMTQAQPRVVASWIQGIGVSRTPCTGSATSPSTKTATSYASATDPRSWPACATPRSPCSASLAGVVSPPDCDI